MSGEFSSIAEVEKKYGIGVTRARKDLSAKEAHDFVRECYKTYVGRPEGSAGGCTHFIHSERPEMKEYTGKLVLGVRAQEVGYGDLADLPLFTAVVDGVEGIIEDILPEEICKIAMSDDVFNQDCEDFKAYVTWLIETGEAEEDITDREVYILRQNAYKQQFGNTGYGDVDFWLEERTWGIFGAYQIVASEDELLETLYALEQESGDAELEFEREQMDKEYAWLSEIEPDDFHDESFDMELVEQFLMYGFKYKRINDYSYIFYNDTYCVVANSYALNGDVAVAAISFDARDVNVEALTMQYQDYYYSGCRAVTDFFNGGVLPARVSGGLCGHNYTFDELRDFLAEC